MQAVKPITMTTPSQKARETLVKRITPTTVKAWAKDVRALESNRLTEHGIKYLAWQNKTWTFDVYGLLMDRIADYWVKGVESNRDDQKGMVYYNPTVGGFELSRNAAYRALAERFTPEAALTLYNVVIKGTPDEVATAILALV